MEKKDTSKPTSMTFADFKHEEVNVVFGLTQLFEDEDLLTKWFSNMKGFEITDLEKQFLANLQHKLVRYGKNWNEQELQTKFIAPVTELVNFDNYDLQVASFAERSLSVDFKNVTIKGIVDWMVASGVHEPKQPFFFLHEYKKELGSGDPVGQLLATMCVAEILNAIPTKPTLFEPKPKSFKNIPLYGCYVMGRFWFFLRLKDKKYFISKPFDAEDTQQLYSIVRLLKAQKTMIKELILSKTS